MDPTVASGVLLSISDLDTEAFDVIGWDLAEVPEPGTMALFATAIVFLASAGRKRQLHSPLRHLKRGLSHFLDIFLNFSQLNGSAVPRRQSNFHQVFVNSRHIACAIQKRK